MSGFEEISKAASAQGMYLVDHTNMAPLISEYENAIKESARLSLILDPVETPFKSKYEAREILDAVASKLEATRTILSLEGKKGIIQEEVDWRYNVIRVYLGTIAFEVEEPHNTQSDLEGAIDFFLPGYRLRVEELCPVAEEGEQPNVAGFEEAAGTLPAITLTDKRVCCDVLKCVNMLGILWAGREQLKKSFLYLLSAKRIYDSISRLSLPDSARSEIESLYTHNLFYLAQAYGHIGNSILSCKYCHETLNRQLSSGVMGAGALEWVKNCMGIGDFYMTMNQYKRCAYALSSAEKVLREKVLPLLSDQESFSDWRSGIREVEADLHRRWLRLEINNMKRSIELIRKCDMTGPNPQNVVVELESQFQGLDVKIPSLFDDILESDGLDVIESRASVIRSLDDATVAFKRGFSRADSAKTILVLDGYVSDHIRILQDQSKLYYYLSNYENDIKRSLALHSRRVDILKPLLGSLSRAAFENFHKEISFECGEAYVTLLDSKLDKFRSKGLGEIDESKLKVVEMKNCNEYCIGSLVMFSHFTGMYRSHEQRVIDILSQDLRIESESQLEFLVSSFCTSPDESLIAEDEVRVFLNAHFMAARSLSKIFTKSIPDLRKGTPTLLSLKKYQWLSEFAPKLCTAKGLDVNNVFKDEFDICCEMVALLPSKLDRIVYLGEDPLRV